MPIKINLYLIDYFSDNLSNGLSTYIKHLSNAVDPDLINLNMVWLDSNATKVPKTIKNPKSGINELHLPKWTGDISDRDAWHGELIAAHIGGTSDPLVHFNWINHCSIAWHLKKKLTCHTVLTLHCISWKDFITTSYTDFRRIENAFIHEKPIEIPVALVHEQMGYESIDQIITVTDCAKKSLELIFSVPSEKITVVRNGLPSGTIEKKNPKTRKALREIYGFKPDETIIIYAGAINRRKGVGDLVEAFEYFLEQNHNPKVRLILAGPGEHTFALKAIKKHWSKITITGSLSKEILYDFYGLSDIGIVPSYIEQCSYSTIEMMHAGLPIIASKVDGLAEMLSDCATFVKVNLNDDGPKTDLNDIADAIRLMVNTPEAALKSGILGYKSARVKHTAERMASETLEVYRKAAAHNQLVENKAKAIALDNYTVEPTLVSILLPVYNGEKFLNECMEDIIAQSYTNWELLIIDDGCSDGSEKIWNKFKDKRIRIIKNQNNMGITSSLNKALKICKGKYVARVDADDKMSRERLAKQVAFLESNPEYGLVGSWHEVIDKYGRAKNRVQPPSIDSDIRLAMLFSNPFAHPAVMMRANIAKKECYDQDFAHCEDYELWTRIAKVSKIANLEEFLTSYRIHDENISRRFAKEMSQNVMTLLSRELDLLGIEHTVDELMVHSALGLGYGPVFFRDERNRFNLDSWLTKLFGSDPIANAYPKEQVQEFKKRILQKNRLA